MVVLQAIGATARGITRVVKALLAAVITIGVIAGIPWGLLHYAGDPIPHSVPTMDAVKHTLTNPMTPQMLLKALSVVGWYLWAILAVSFLVELVAAARRVNAPHIPTLGPTQALAAAVIAAIGITALLRAAPAHAAETVSAPVPTGGRVSATAPATAGNGGLSSAHRSVGNTASAAPRETVHTVKTGESLYSIAQQDLGDGNDWPALYTMNQGVVQADGAKLTNPDLIRPDWKIRIPAPDAVPAAPTGGGAVTAPTAHAPAPTGLAAPTTPAPVTSAPTAAPTADRSPHSATGAPRGTGASHGASATPGQAAGDRAQRRHGGAAVSLPDGGAIGITLAVALGSAIVLARRWRNRQADPRLPVAEPPLPGALQAARRAQFLLNAAPIADEPETDEETELDDDLFDTADPSGGPSADPGGGHAPRERHDDGRGDEPGLGEDTDEDDELDEFGAPTGPVPAPRTPRFNAPLPPGAISAAERDGVELPLPATGPGLGLVGPGATGAARAIAAGVLSAGAPDRTADLARLVIPAVDLAALLGVEPSALPELTRGVPELTVTPDLATAIGEAEVHALWRTRLLEEYEVADLDSLAAEHPEEVDCPPLVLMASPSRALAVRIGALMDTAAPLRITSVLLGAHPGGATAFVEADGTATGPAAESWSGARLWNLGRSDLADILALLACASGNGPTTPERALQAQDWPETTTASADHALADGQDGGAVLQLVTGQPDQQQSAPATPQPVHRAEPAAGEPDPAPQEPGDSETSSTDAEPEAADGNDYRESAPARVAEPSLASPSGVDENPAAPRLALVADPAGQRAADMLAAWVSRPVRISILGALRIEVAGTPVTGLRSQARTLAALLAWKGTAGISDAGIDTACCPDEDDLDRVARWRQDGLKSLRARLRESTGRKMNFVPLRDRRDYLLDPEHVAVDLWVFRALDAAAGTARAEADQLRWLAQAVEFCTGEFLAEETRADFVWAEWPRVTVKSEQVSVLARYAELAARAGQPEQALAALRQAAAMADDPEYLYRRMFDLLAALGRHTEIAAQMAVLDAAADAVGAMVAPETRQHAARLLRPTATGRPR